jgi:hypothetical protein
MDRPSNGPAEKKLEPCGYMRRWISLAVDGSLRGVVAAYVRYHVSHCGRCRAALAGLRELRERLRATKSRGPEALDPPHSAELKVKLDEVEGG